MLTKIDAGEAKRIWDVAVKISKAKTVRQVCDKWGKLAKLEGGGDLSRQPLAITDVFYVGKIVARIEANRDDLSCAPGASTEDIDEILQAHENSEALLEALFSYTVAAVDQAFRYGYYAALEDEAKDEENF